MSKGPRPLGAHGGQRWDSGEKPPPPQLQRCSRKVPVCQTVHLTSQDCLLPVPPGGRPLLPARRWGRPKSGPFHVLVTTHGICFTSATNRSSERPRGCPQATERRREGEDEGTQGAGLAKTRVSLRAPFPVPEPRPPKARPSPLNQAAEGASRPAAPNGLRGASLPGGGGERRAAGVWAGGTRRGRGGRRRRWQPAGTHAAPRPAWPAALPPLGGDGTMPFDFRR